jgi:chitinase
VASTSGLRAAFAHSCATAAARWDLDGIDIDWEYPGYEEHGGTIADRRNFTLLLRSLSDTLIALGRLAGKQYLLTAALPAGGVHVRNIEAAEVAEVLDRVNLMTYDFYGPWDPLTNHNSPLYPSPGSDPSRCVDASVRLYRDTLGVPASKLTIGIPVYGKAYARCVALNTPHGGADTTHFRPGGPFYYDIAPVAASFTARWDEQARVPYLVHPAWQVLVSYDDPASIRAKAEYAVAQGLGGVIIWEITGDVMPDGATPLLDALVGTFKLTGSQVR